MIIQKNYIRKFYGIFSNNGGIKVVVIFVRLQFEQCLKLILKTSNNTVTYFWYRLINIKLYHNIIGTSLSKSHLVRSTVKSVLLLACLYVCPNPLFG